LHPTGFRPAAVSAVSTGNVLTHPPAR
jgi:hypothetical protein